MKDVVVLTPPEARDGFALAGVRQQTLRPDELPAALQRALADPTVGLVVVDERLVSGAMQVRLRELEQRSPGVVVLLPAPDMAAVPGEDYVTRLIQRAIGYQVRLGP